MFQAVTINTTALVVGVNDFPVQTPILSEAAFFNNFGAALSIIGGGLGVLGDENPSVATARGVFRTLGGIFSDVGVNLQTSTPADTLSNLEMRLSNVLSQVTTNTVTLLTL